MSKSKMTRTALSRLIVLAAVAAVSLPVGASAAQPALSVDLVAGPQVTYADTVSGLTFRMTQPDFSAPAVGVDFYIPKGWRFSLASLRPAQTSGGAPATTCEDVHNGLGTHNDNNGATLGNAENTAGGVGFTANATIQFIDGAARRTARFGYTRHGPSRNSSGTTGRQNPSLAFLNWDGTTAKFCLYAYAANFNLDHTDSTGLFFSDANYESSRQHLIPVTLTRLPSTDPKFGWKLALDTTSVYWDPFLQKAGVNITQLLLYFEGLTGGNWHRNPVNDQPDRLAFSRTPVEPGTYEFKGEFLGCMDGIKQAPAGPYAAPHWRPAAATPADLCVNGRTVAVSKSSLVDITLPPVDPNTHDFARLTGPSTPGMPAGYGLLRNTGAFNVTWNQPTANPNEQIKGYAVAIAPPGDESRMHEQYLVTDPASAGFDTREICGADGARASCSLPLAFPINAGNAAVPLDQDGKYDIALITVYKDGHRSDGRCDDGTVRGASCGPLTPDFAINSLGVSTWQFLSRTKTWPTAYVETQTVKHNCCPGTFTAPRHVLLVDYGRKQAEFVFWNPLGKEVAYFAASNQIQETPARSVVSFNSGNVASTAPSWRFDGLADASLMRGVFSSYTVHNLNTSGANPKLQAFTGTKL